MKDEQIPTIERYLKLINHYLPKINYEKAKLFDKKYSSSVTSVVFSPDNKYVAIGSEDRHLRVIDVKTGKEHFNIKHDRDVESVVFSPNGQQIATGSGYFLRFFDVNKGNLLREFEYKYSHIYSISWSPNKKYVATANGDECSRIINADTGNVL